MSGMPIIGRTIPLLDVVRRDPRTPDFFDGCSDGIFNGNLHWIILRGRLRSHDAKRRKYFSSSTGSMASLPDPASTYLKSRGVASVYTLHHLASPRRRAFDTFFYHSFHLTQPLSIVPHPNSRTTLARIAVVLCPLALESRCITMKEFGTFLGYALATAAVGALLIFLGGMDHLPSWVLPLAALLSVVVMPVVLGIVIARRGKQRAATTPDNS